MSVDRCIRPSGLSEAVKAKIAADWMGGFNSADIALRHGLRERAVCKVLAEQQDARHALRQREAQRA